MFFIPRKWLPLIGIATLAYGAASCSRSEPPVRLPGTWVWDQTQELITPALGSRNVWSGWSIQGDAFEAQATIAGFIVWARASRPYRVYLTYSLVGQPVEVTCNRHRQSFTLRPSQEYQSLHFELPLIQGMNFLEFYRRANDRLRIKRMSLDRPDPPEARHLRQGEELTLFHHPGQGYIEWRGSGTLAVTTHENIDGRLCAKSETFRTHLFKKRIRYRIQRLHSGITIFKAVSGGFDVNRYAFDEKMQAASPVPKPLLSDSIPIFILLADGCQAKHLSAYGYFRRTSPNLERFARDAVLFENAYANASFTRSSVRSLMSGLVPEIRNVDILTPIGLNKQLTIAEFLKAKGYRTAIFTSAVNISPKIGFTKGFDDYETFYKPLNAWQELRIDLDRFGEWLRRPEPLFAYIHFIQPHLRTLPPPPFIDMFKANPPHPPIEFKKRLMPRLGNKSVRYQKFFSPAEIQEVIDDYDANIAYVDERIGRALDHIRNAGLYDRSLIIVLSDHGEAMYEHGVWGHSENVYEETTHVPLIMKFPSAFNFKGSVRTLVQISDIFPTLQELFGRRLILSGTSLLDAIRQKEIDDSMVVSQTISSAAQFAARWRNWYWMIDLNSGRSTLYDLAQSRMEEAGDTKAGGVKRFLLARFLEWYKRHSDIDPTPTTLDVKQLTESEIERLKSLGYL